MSDKEFHRENIKQVLLMLSSVPAKNLNLDIFRQDEAGTPPSCGSVACVGGWTPYWPHFSKLGVTACAHEEGAPRMEGVRWASDVAMHLFGCEEAFVARGANRFDLASPRHTDHAVAVRRFTKMLAVLDAKP